MQIYVQYRVKSVWYNAESFLYTKIFEMDKIVACSMFCLFELNDTLKRKQIRTVLFIVLTNKEK